MYYNFTRYIFALMSSNMQLAFANFTWRVYNLWSYNHLRWLQYPFAPTPELSNLIILHILIHCTLDILHYRMDVLLYVVCMWTTTVMSLSSWIISFGGGGGGALQQCVAIPKMRKIRQIRESERAEPRGPYATPLPPPTPTPQHS
jgi:hypothetical protein